MSEKKENKELSSVETEIKGLFEDVEDVSSLDDDAVVQRIEDYLNSIDPEAIEQNGVFLNPEDIITLTDEEGNQLYFIEAAEMNMQGKTYALLQNISDCSTDQLTDNDADVYVFEVVTDGDPEDKVYVPVEDDALLADIVENYEVMLADYYNSLEEKSGEN